MEFLKKNFSLFLILLFGIFLRIWRLDLVPVSMFGDEIDVGVQANSILVTGRDYLSNFMPVYFQSFAEFRLPMQLYFAVPFIKLFGMNEWGVRLGSVVFGVVSLWGIYLLVKELFSKRVALIATLFLSISPWHLQFSRQANDSGFMLPFILFGTWLFIRGLREYKFLLISASIFALSFYSYATAALFTPLFVLVLLVIYRKKIFKLSPKRIAVVAILVLVTLVPYIVATRNSKTTARFNYISVASEQEIAGEIAKKRGWSDSSLTRLFYNRKSIIFSEVLKNYLNTFSTNYLFVNGDPILRHSVGGMGELYYFDLILIVFGIYVLTRGYRKQSGKYSIAFTVLLVWLLVAPIPSSITDGGGYHAARQLPMLPVFIILSALGLDYFIKKADSGYRTLLMFILFFVMIVNIGFYLHKYYVVWPKESWRFWHSGYKEVMTYAKENDANFNKVFINNTYEPALPRFLFWYQYNPELFLEQFEDDKHIEGIIEGFDGFKLGEKYYFGEFQKPLEQLLDRENLIIASARDDITDVGIFNKPEITLLKTIYSPVKTPLFYVFTASE